MLVINVAGMTQRRSYAVLWLPTSDPFSAPGTLYMSVQKEVMLGILTCDLWEACEVPIAIGPYVITLRFKMLKLYGSGVY
jgi:hypothetical protein